MKEEHWTQKGGVYSTLHRQIEEGIRGGRIHLVLNGGGRVELRHNTDLSVVCDAKLKVTRVIRLSARVRDGAEDLLVNLRHLRLQISLIQLQQSLAEDINKLIKTIWP